MTLDGRVVDGRIVLDRAEPLPDGARVQVRLVAGPPPERLNPVDGQPLMPELDALRERLARRAAERAANPGADPGPTLAERLKDFLAHDLDLPADAATNVDHYLYGAPKRPEA